MDEDSREWHPAGICGVFCQHQHRPEPGNVIPGLDLDLEILHRDPSLPGHLRKKTHEHRIPLDDTRIRPDPRQFGMRRERDHHFV